MRRWKALLEGLGTSLRAALPPPPPPRGTIPLDWALPRLLPKVRSRLAYEVFGLRQGGRKPEARPLGGAFGHSLVVEASEGELDLTAAHLAAWGLDFDRLLLTAKRNLLARGGEERFERSRYGFHRSTWEDGLDGSRILLPGILRRLGLQGEPVVFLPHKDVLLVAGSEDPGGLCAALEGTLELLDGGTRASNGCPLRLNGFQWEAFGVAKGHPAAPMLAKINHRRLQEENAHPTGPGLLEPLTAWEVLAAEART